MIVIAIGSRKSVWDEEQIKSFETRDDLVKVFGTVARVDAHHAYFDLDNGIKAACKHGWLGEFPRDGKLAKMFNLTRMPRIGDRVSGFIGADDVEKGHALILAGVRKVEPK